MFVVTQDNYKYQHEYRILYVKLEPKCLENMLLSFKINTKSTATLDGSCDH